MKNLYKVKNTNFEDYYIVAASLQMAIGTFTDNYKDARPSHNTIASIEFVAPLIQFKD
jgi:hypothetical protein